MKRQKIEALIDDQLITDEAKKRATTLPALYDAEVTSKVTMVTEAEIDAYCAKSTRQVTPSGAQGR